MKSETRRRSFFAVPLPRCRTSKDWDGADDFNYGWCGWNGCGGIALVCGLCAWGALRLAAFFAMTAMPIAGGVAVFQGIKALRSEQPGGGVVGIGLGAMAVLLAAWNWYRVVAG